MARSPAVSRACQRPALRRWLDTQLVSGLHGDAEARTTLIAWAHTLAFDAEAALRLRGLDAGLEPDELHPVTAAFVRATATPSQARRLPARARSGHDEHSMVELRNAFGPLVLRAPFELIRRPDNTHFAHARRRAIRHPSLRLRRHLLNHAALREKDVVAMAAHRPTRAGLLLAVAQEARWLSRRGVREALVSNPYTPSWLVAALLPVAPLPVVHSHAHHHDATGVKQLARAPARRTAHSS